MRIYVSIFLILIAMLLSALSVNSETLKETFMEEWRKGYCELNACNDALAKKHFSLIGYKIDLELDKSSDMELADKKNYLKNRLQLFRHNLQHLDGRMIPSIEDIDVQKPIIGSTFFSSLMSLLFFITTGIVVGFLLVRSPSSLARKSVRTSTLSVSDTKESQAKVQYAKESTAKSDTSTQTSSASEVSEGKDYPSTEDSATTHLPKIKFSPFQSAFNSFKKGDQK